MYPPTQLTIVRIPSVDSHSNTRIQDKPPNKKVQAKLDAALNALDDLNSNNDIATSNSLNAFINAVEVQRGSELTDEQANILIESAQAIIAAIESGI